MFTYEKISTISNTSKSRVYLADMEGKKEPVIIKEIMLADTHIYEQIRQMNSPYFPKIYAYETKDNQSVIAEEYVEGYPIDVYAREHELTTSDYIHLFTQICDGIGQLHRQTPPIIHRDIKPANLLVTNEGNIKIIDFDSSRNYTSDSQKDTRLLGTEGYAPPEQFGYAQTDVRSDIYAIGVTMYEVIFGQSFPKDHALLSNRSICDTCRFPELANSLLTVIRKCTQFNPDTRYVDTTHLKKAILQCNPACKKKHTRRIVAVTAFTLAMIAGVTAYAVHSAKSKPLDYSIYENMSSYAADNYNAETGQSEILILNYLQTNPSLSPFQFSVNFEDGAAPKQLVIYDEETQVAAEIDSAYWKYEENHMIHISDKYLCSLEPGHKYLLSFVYETLRYVVYVYPVTDLDDIIEQFNPGVTPGYGTFQLSNPQDFVFSSTNAFGRRITGVYLNDTGEELPPEYYSINEDGTIFTLSGDYFSAFDAGSWVDLYVNFEEDPSFKYNGSCGFGIEISE